MHWLSNYTKAIANIAAAGDATELSYRTPIQNMLQAAQAEFGIVIEILQEPRRVKNSGAPDFRISAQGGGVIGYVECKPPGATLQKPATTAQLDKYRALSNNILLTDCWRWRLLRGGKTIAELGLTESPDKSTKADFTGAIVKSGVWEDWIKRRSD